MSAAASVFVSHRQMQVFTGGDVDDLGVYTVGDELVHLSAENVLTVFTGVHTGEVDVVVHVDVAAPPDEPGWDVASEATHWCSDATLTVCGLMGHCPDELREIAVPGPGLVRVQARARGLSSETEPGPEQPPEESAAVGAGADQGPVDHAVRVDGALVGHVSSVP